MECNVAASHIESFNYLADEGLQAAAGDIPAAKLRLPHGEAIEFAYSSLNLGYPCTSDSANSEHVKKLYPAECRQRELSYRAPLHARIELSCNGLKLDSVDGVIGEIPVMLRSNRCNLHGLSSEEMIYRGEEPTEPGGYFISSGGSEKILRLLVATKRNFPLAMQRRSARDKGKLFTDYSVMMRSARGQHRIAVNSLHYLESDTIVVTIAIRREIYYVPLMYVLRCLTDMNDERIFTHMTRLRPGDNAWAGCVTNMLALARDSQVVSRAAALKALGSRFRVVLGAAIAPWEEDEEAARFLMRYYLAIHVDTDEKKFFSLVLMALKLIALVRGEILPESPDNPQFQEASLSGQILLLIIRDRLEAVLAMTRKKLELTAGKQEKFEFNKKEFIKALGLRQKTGSSALTHRLDHFLASGNLADRADGGLGLMQTTGFSVVLERINYLRFVSHFRAIHRGAFFTEMRTTDVRKLRPEAWGFICPVHTPDGSPCGLLNHLTAACRILTHCVSTKKLPAVLNRLGLLSHGEVDLFTSDDGELYPVVLDGEFIGYLPTPIALRVERQLRAMKVDLENDEVPSNTEIALIPRSFDASVMATQFPGLHIYTVVGRMNRPVHNIPFDCVEFIGPFEQVYLSIAVFRSEVEHGVTHHREIHPTAALSFAANLIPFADHNQSPRNVYQCQMGKQTMGVPVYAWNRRADNKMYLLRYPQKPLVKTSAYDLYQMDEYPMGTNACVCVISYTGYDMEDAMVINRGSFQRGFGHGSVIKVERINLVERRAMQNLSNRIFHADPKTKTPSIDADGLPIPGRLYREGDVYYSTFDQLSRDYQVHRFKQAEPAYCGLVRVVDGDSTSSDKFQHALVQWRIPRNPIIGDKFASRHGQKGINSFLWPAESMPFSANGGIVPDILFNPHGFPSRMTIGMMVESMAGKASAMHGYTQDATPFRFNEENTAIEHFGEALSKAGFDHLGTETLYSGVDGREMEVQIFTGLVYYQRLRHMIEDKFQVRSTGPVDPVTLQPVKGRKKQGGVRFGEMERDALISHGANFCLRDRLLICSDQDSVFVCANCESIVSVTKLRPKPTAMRQNTSRLSMLGSGGKNEENYQKFATRRHCSICNSDQHVHLAQVPRILRYLAAELSSVNVKLQMHITHPAILER